MDSRSTTQLPPPVYYLEPYNYEFLTPISFTPSPSVKTGEKDVPSPNQLSRTETRNIFSKILKPMKEPWKMASLLTHRSKYLGYEKAADLEADDAASSQAESSSEISSIIPPTQAKSRVDARVISDAIIGLSDGMTVPFALTAGLSAMGDTRVVIFGGFAELIAGAISMGLGGYLGAKSEEQSYNATLETTRQEASISPTSAALKIHDIFSGFDIPDHLIGELTTHLIAQKESENKFAKTDKLTSFLMRFEHSLPSAPAATRAFTCALTIALGYFLGGFIPLLPYLFVARHQVWEALVASIVIMGFALFSFGYGKTCFVSGWRGRQNIISGLRGGVEMVIVGGLAAGCAMGLVRGFNALL